MAQVPPYPSYYFRVDQLLEQTYHPRAHPSQGYWQPPRRRGANRTAPFPATSQQLALGPGRAFYFNGDQLIPQPMQLPQHLVHSYTEYSMYVGEGQELFIVPYDASTNTVYNGVDDGTDPLPPPDHAPDWSELSFERIENSPDRISVAGFRLPHRHLRLWLRRQEWVQQIIPAPYRPQMQTRLNERRDSPQGGLVGNIALMIGLLALSIPPQVVLQALPRLMQRTWDCLPLSAYHGATARQAKRGVVVKVWADEPSQFQFPPNQPGQAAYNTAVLEARVRIRSLERGRFGPIFD